MGIQCGPEAQLRKLTAPQEIGDRPRFLKIEGTRVQKTWSVPYFSALLNFPRHPRSSAFPCAHRDRRPRPSRGSASRCCRRSRCAGGGVDARTDRVARPAPRGPHRCAKQLQLPGELNIGAAILEAPLIERSLTLLGVQARGPSRAPARGQMLLHVAWAHPTHQRSSSPPPRAEEPNCVCGFLGGSKRRDRPG